MQVGRGWGLLQWARLGEGARWPRCPARVPQALRAVPAAREDPALGGSFPSLLSTYL